MKKLGILLMVMVLGTTMSFAQNRGGQRNFDPKERAKETTATLKEKLDLKKDQEKKVYDLSLESNNKMAEMRKDMQATGRGFEGMRDKMTKMREEQNKKMKAILSEAQYKKYEKYLEEQRTRRGQGRGNR